MLIIETRARVKKKMDEGRNQKTLTYFTPSSQKDCSRKEALQGLDLFRTNSPTLRMSAALLVASYYGTLI